jgi:hypothetical protein
LNIGVGLLLILGILYRITCYTQYLEACKFIYYAGDSIIQEAAPKKTPKELDPFEIGDFVSPQAIHEDGEPSMEMTPLAEETTIGEPPLPEMHKAEDEPVVMPVAENKTTISLEASEIPNKGSINTILLHELIKQECGQANIYRGDIHKNVIYYSHITGCKPKNILDKTKYYRNREALNLTTPNSRTTHRKYLEILLQYYGETGDDILYNKAEDLQSFIESINGRRK